MPPRSAGSRITASEASTPNRVRFGVLADDLTGALASAARLRDAKRPAVVIWEPDALPTDGSDVVVDMRTRDKLGPAKSYTAAWARRLLRVGVTRLELRIDSTLRGYTHHELAGVLDACGTADVLVVAIPAFPGAGRTTLDGHQVIRAAAEQYRVSVAEKIFPSGAGPLVIPAPVASVQQMADTLCSEFQRGQRWVIFDAAAAVDIRAAAEVCSALAARGVTVVTLSPGAALRYAPPAKSSGFVLCVVASPTRANAAQLEALKAAHPRGALVTASQVLDEGLRIPQDADLVVMESLSDTTNHDPSARAAIAARALLDQARDQMRPCHGAIVTGGNAAASVLRELRARAVLALGEVAPLCPTGTLDGGLWSGMRLITKGGRIGDDDCLVRLVNHLAPGDHPRILPPSMT